MFAFFYDVISFIFSLILACIPLLIGIFVLSIGTLMQGDILIQFALILIGFIIAAPGEILYLSRLSNYFW